MGSEPGFFYTMHLLHSNPQSAKVRRINGLIDTGADTTCMESKVMFDMGYVPVGEIEVEGATGVETCPTFYAAFDLPDHQPVYRVEMRVVGLPSLPSGKNDPLGLIGRDLLNLGEFRCNKEGFSLRLQPHQGPKMNVQALQAYRAAMAGRLPPLGRIVAPPRWQEIQALAAGVAALLDWLEVPLADVVLAPRALGVVGEAGAAERTRLARAEDASLARAPVLLPRAVDARLAPMRGAVVGGHGLSRARLRTPGTGSGAPTACSRRSPRVCTWGRCKTPCWRRAPRLRG